MMIDLLQQQSQSATPIQPAATRELTMDASSVFSFFEPSVPQLDNRLPQLMDRLDSLKERQQELTSQINDAQNELLKAQEVLQSVIDAMQNNKLIPEEIYSLLGPLGISGMLDVVHEIPVIRGLGILYKRNLQKIRTELERKIGEMAKNIESLKSEIAEVNHEISSVQDQIVKEKLRQEKEAQPAHEMIGSDAIVQEPVWQESFSDQNLIRQENLSFVTSLNPMFHKKDDE